jgi:BolA protein
MDTPTQIRTLLTERLQASSVEIVDESHRHAGHTGRQDPLSAGGHYALYVVSPLFVGKTLLQRHRLVYDALATEMGSTIHALSIQAFTPD